MSRSLPTKALAAFCEEEDKSGKLLNRMDTAYRKKLAAGTAYEAARTAFKAEWTEQCTA